ncbi:MAG: hypothetical protein GXO43_06150 [Crenarchaeota archaeon]|nr:hypothetical protein [Thermoproteota archaeon]
MVMAEPVSRPHLFPKEIVESEIYNKKIFYGLSPHEIEERLWWRVERVRELNKEIYRVVTPIYAPNIESVHKRYGAVSEVVVRYVLSYYMKAIRKGGIYAENIKHLLALYLMIFHWIKTETVREVCAGFEYLYGLYEHLTDVRDSCIDKYSSRTEIIRCVMDSLGVDETSISGMRNEIVKFIPYLITRFHEGGHVRVPHEFMLDHIDYRYASTTPLASHVVSSIIRNYGYGEESGKRISVSGHLGAGKTTFVFLSLYAALRFLGIPKERAVKYIHALMFNHPIELFMFTDMINSGIVERVPFLVVDDVSSILSKYWIFEDRYMKQAMVGFNKAIKIIRESVGISIFISDVSEAIAKGIRESIDIRIESEQVAPTSVSAQYYEVSLWMDTTTYRPVSARKSGELRLSPSTANKIAMLTGTATPPFYIPDHVYRDLTTIKKLIRRYHMKKTRDAMMTPIIKMIKNMEKQQEENKEEE